MRAMFVIRHRLWIVFGVSLGACAADAPADASTRAGATPALATQGSDTATSPAVPNAGGATPSSDGVLLPAVSVPPPTQDPAVGMPTQIPNGPILIDQTGPDNPAGLSPADAQALLNGGDAAWLRFFYPYDNNGFPRRILGPVFVW